MSHLQATAGQASPSVFPNDIAALRDADEVVTAAVAAAFMLPIAELRTPGRRSAPAAFARQAAMYLAHVVFELSYTDVGHAFGRDRTTAAHACRLMEDRRTDQAIDRQLAALEHLVRRSCGLIKEVVA